MLTPAYLTDPAEGSRWPVSSRKRLDFPAPDGPMIAGAASAPGQTRRNAERANTKPETYTH